MKKNSFAVVYRRSYDKQYRIFTSFTNDKEKAIECAKSLGGANLVALVKDYAQMKQLERLDLLALSGKQPRRTTCQVSCTH